MKTPTKEAAEVALCRGKPLDLTNAPLAVHKRFWAQVRKTAGCWEWTGKIHSIRSGYGIVTIDYKAHRAHRVAYALVKGPIPAALMVCHTCDNRICVNPDHLFLGDHTINVRDCVAKGRHCEQKKTHCKNGHEFSETNTRIEGRQRVCIICRRASQRKSDFRRRHATHPANATNRGGTG